MDRGSGTGRVGAGRQDPAVVLAGLQFTVVAIADTGGDRPELVEIGVAVLDSGALDGQPRTWLVRPEQSITRWATRAHGIGDGDVATAPAVRTVADQILTAIGGRPVITHRGMHCHTVLAAALPGWSPPRVLDLRRLATLAWPATSLALGALEATARLTVPGMPGRARHDTAATAGVFLAATRRLNVTAGQLTDRATVAHRVPDGTGG
ncbi:MAG TPA: 3'-5' exonuclease [Mycobacteriales bacterium]|nr:3'-5' exonuclease [Mycobacteriales bacterium]